MRRYTGQGATAWAVVLVLAGFGLIAFGWRGAAAAVFVPTQLAYALSGGMVGLGLIGAGAAIAYSQLSRVVSADAHHELDGLTTRTAELLAALQERADR